MAKALCDQPNLGCIASWRNTPVVISKVVLGAKIGNNHLLKRSQPGLGPDYEQRRIATP
jgi:hypothetical protein